MGLQARRWPSAPVRFPLTLFFCLFLIWELIPRHERRRSGAEIMSWLIFCLSLGGLYCFREYAWTPPMVGTAFGVYFWTLGELRGRSCPIAVTGCLLGACAAPLVPWPAVDQSLLVIIGAGSAVSLQGAWIVIGHIRGIYQPPPEPAPAAPGVSFTRFIVSTFGPMECSQIISPALESKLRRRYQFSIDELSNLGFSYLCCYSDSFAAPRLLLGFPLLTLFFMLRGREIMRLREGRIHIHYLLTISRDQATYAHAFGLGVKFYTAFSDGTCLITANLPLKSYNRPPVTKCYLETSIPDAWAAHQQAVAEREASGVRAIRHSSFPTFAQMSDRENKAESS
jgi:hypothetical protein